MQSRDRILYLECGTGISGDMTVAALLDLGADQEKLLRVLKGIPGHGFEVRISRVKKAAIDCCDFDVVLDKEHDGHDHDMEYLYGMTMITTMITIITMITSMTMIITMTTGMITTITIQV